MSNVYHLRPKTETQTGVVHDIREGQPRTTVPLYVNTTMENGSPPPLTDAQVKAELTFVAAAGVVALMGALKAIKWGINHVR